MTSDKIQSRSSQNEGDKITAVRLKEAGWKCKIGGYVNSWRKGEAWFYENGGEYLSSILEVEVVLTRMSQLAAIEKLIAELKNA